MSDSQGCTRDFPVAMLATPGGKHLATRVDEQLRALCHENGEVAPPTFLCDSCSYRFQNGEGKGVIRDSVRGKDLYIFCDPGNHGVEYTRYGQQVPMGPDEHFQDLKRLLGAAKNMPQRTSVIMPLLYESRQHKMHGRESLDCALALQELVRLGVDEIMTIDAHNSHVMNAIPMTGLENLHATYQLIKAFLSVTNGEVAIHPDTMLAVSPDLGGMERARYFAEHLRIDLAGFYKRRDLSRIVNGKNPVIEHMFLGPPVTDMTILVIDDLLASGGSLLEVCSELRERGAGPVYLSVTYALFSEGFEKYDEAYADGLFVKLFGTNGTYIPEELRQREWFEVVDVTRFIGKFIRTMNKDQSVSKLLDSTERINQLLGRTFPQPAETMTA